MPLFNARLIEKNIKNPKPLEQAADQTICYSYVFPLKVCPNSSIAFRYRPPIKNAALCRFFYW